MASDLAISRSNICWAVLQFIGGPLPLLHQTVDVSSCEALLAYLICETVSFGSRLFGLHLANRHGVPGDRRAQVAIAHLGQFGRSGFGLALARCIAERHGGSLVLEGRPGRGVVATLHIPDGEDA